MTQFTSQTSRRHFIQGAGALTTLTCLGFTVGTKAAARYPMGLQLYTVREPMAKDAIGTLKQIAAIGYRDLETYGFDAERVAYYGFKADVFKRILENNGLTTSSGHYDLFLFLNKPVEELTSYVDRCIEGALALGQKYITWPWLKPESRSIDAFHTLADRLNRIGEQIHKAGLGLAYHNHDFEFIAHDGQTGWDIIVRDTDPALVKLQLDLFWAAHSSPWSPHELFKRQPGRYVMWHIKDMDRVNRNLYTELGNGTIDFTRIMPHAALAGLEYYFVEQGDNFAIDPIRSITDSAAYVKRYLR